MSFKFLDKISVTTAFTEMIELQKQLGANLIAIDCPWVQGKGKLGLLQDPENFSVWNGGPYNTHNRQAPTYPNIHSGTSTINHKRMRAKKIKDQQNW